MHALHHSTRLARLVLAWFALALGVAMASPLVQPRAMELVCSGGAGVKLVVLGDDGQALPAHGQQLDCPACLGTLAPPLPAQARPALPPAQPATALPGAPPHAALVAGAPLPPRGPPALA